MGSVRWRVLGETGVEIEGELQQLAGQRQRAVLAYLVLNGDRVVTTDQVIDALWGDEPPKTARNSVQRFVADLRRSLEPEAARLATVNGGYRLDTEGSVVDLVEAERLIDQGRRALSDGDPDAAMTALDEALALWNGQQPLAGVGEATFVEAEVVRLAELRRSAEEDRIEAALAIGRHHEAISELEALVAIDPFRERLWGQLMLALYRDGRQVDALAAYARLRELLVEELGVDPSPALQELEVRILDQDPALDDARAGPVAGPGEVDPRVRHYELGEEVKTDSRAVIRRGIQRTLGREVAIKAIPAELANRPEFIRRFEAEAQLVAGLEHPNVVPLYDYWREPDQAYLVMRWLSGGTLTASLERDGPWPLARVITLVTQIGGALAAAHRAGIVHRDVKPDNILFDEAGIGYLGNFGIAYSAPAPMPSDVGLDEAVDRLASSDAGADRLRGEPPAAAVDIFGLGATVYEALTGGPPPDDWPEDGFAAGPEVERVLRRALDADPDRRHSSVGDLVADFEALADPALMAGPVSQVGRPAAAGPVENPYKGLQAFQEGDNERFFGRGDAIDRLVRSLGRRRLVAVVGPSGSGKSSVVRAGLVPAVRRGAISGSDRWFVVDMTPGSSPFEELSTALRRVAIDAPERLLAQLATDEHGLRRAVEFVLPGDEGELVLVIDQFEELFTLVPSERVRARFIEALVAAVTDPRSRLRVVITLRADFFDRPLGYHDFGDLVSTGTETLAALSAEQLERAIALPAEREGVTFERGLVAEIATDVVDQPAALPLLQYALTELFERRDGEVIGLAAYDEVGGVLGALAVRATQVLTELDPAARELARQLFLRLVTIGDNADDTRRRVRRSEVAALGPGDDVDRVLEAFGRYRLLTFDRHPTTREPTVEVAHEALLREWSGLRSWIDESRDDLRTHRRLLGAVREWQAAGGDDSFLLTGTRLEQIERWRESTDLTLADDENRFVDASLEAHATEEAVEQERAAHEAELERRSLRRLRVLVAVLAAAAVVAGTLTVVALDRGRAAERAARDATVRGLVLASGAELGSDPELAMLLAIEAAEESVAGGEEIGNDVVEALHEAFASFRVIRRFEPASVAVLDPTDRFVIGAGPDDRGRIFDVETGELIRELLGHTDRVVSVTISADGSRIATGSVDGTARIWDAATGLGLVSFVHPEAVTRVVFSPDGSALATAAADGVVRRWNPTTGREEASLPVGPLGSAGDLAWLDGGARLAVVRLSGEPQVLLVDAATFDPEPEIVADGAPYCAVGHDPASGRFVLGSRDGQPRLLDGAGAEPELLTGHSALVCQVAVGPGGDLVATGSIDGTARVWSGSTPYAELAGHSGPVNTVAFDSSGTRVLTAAADGEARLWDVRTPVGGELYAATVADVPGDLFQPGLLEIHYRSDGRGVLIGPPIDSNPGIWSFDFDDRSGARWRAEHGWDLAVHPGGEAVATNAGVSGAVALIDPATGATLELLASQGQGIETLAYSGDGELLVVGDAAGRIHLWPRGAAEPTTITVGENVQSVAASADGDLVVAVTQLGVVQVLEGGPDGDLRLIDDTAQCCLHRIALTSDGSLVAVSGGGGARIWDVASGAQVASLDHDAETVELDFSGDGRLLATAGADGRVVIWDATDGSRLVSLAGRPEVTVAAADVVFGPDDRTIATVDAAGLIQVRPLDPVELVELARARVTRDLSAEECDRFTPDACQPPA